MALKIKIPFFEVLPSKRMVGRFRTRNFKNSMAILPVFQAPSCSMRAQDDGVKAPFRPESEEKGLKHQFQAQESDGLIHLRR